MENHDVCISWIRPVHRWSGFRPIYVLLKIDELGGREGDRRGSSEDYANNSADFTDADPLRIQERCKNGGKNDLKNVV